jgi:hypothetical protein
MRTKLLAVGSLAAGFALFGWQTISQSVLPWHAATMREFANAPKVVAAIRAAAPENGMYIAEEGILAVVSLAPAGTDRLSPAVVGPKLAKQLVTDVLVALLLCMLLLAIPHITPAEGARTAAIAALAAALTIHVSNWTWYGFSPIYVIVNSIDLVIGWAIVGFVLGWLVRRMTLPETPHGAGAGVNAHADPGPRAGSLRPVGRHSARVAGWSTAYTAFTAT